MTYHECRMLKIYIIIKDLPNSQLSFSALARPEVPIVLKQWLGKVIMGHVKVSLVGLITEKT